MRRSHLRLKTPAPAIEGLVLDHETNQIIESAVITLFVQTSRDARSPRRARATSAESVLHFSEIRTAALTNG